MGKQDKRNAATSGLFRDEAAPTADEFPPIGAIAPELRTVDSPHSAELTKGRGLRKVGAGLLIMGLMFLAALGGFELDSFLRPDISESLRLRNAALNAQLSAANAELKTTRERQAQHEQSEFTPFFPVFDSLIKSWSGLSQNQKLRVTFNKSPGNEVLIESTESIPGASAGGTKPNDVKLLDSEYRNWRDAHARLLAPDARLSRIQDSNGTVELIFRNGNAVLKGMSDLSGEDQDYVKNCIIQVSNGLLFYGGKWLTPSVLESARKRDRVKAYEEHADTISMSKSKGMASFRVIRSLSGASICILGVMNRETGNIDFNGEVFCLYGTSSDVISDGSVFRDNLYWAGTFKTPAATINCYNLDKARARSGVLTQFGLYDMEGTQNPPRQSFGNLVPRTGGSELIGFGSGFFVTGNGYILTAEHVIQRARQINVKTEKGVLPAQVIARNAVYDLALLKVEGIYEPASLAGKNSAILGQTAFTLGFPLPDIQGFSPKVTKGIISGLNGQNDNVMHYQIDATAQPGNSGGPLADENGDIIGMIESQLNEAAVFQRNGNLPQNVNYALKLFYIKEFLESNPSAWKNLPSQNSPSTIAFEAAVDKVRKSTVLIMVY